MNDEFKSCDSQTPEAEPTAVRSTMPIWIIVLTLLLLFLGAVYFDHHSGWFDKQVYAPYTSADELASYQPKFGAASMLAHGKKVYEIRTVLMALTASANPARHRRWPAPNGRQGHHVARAHSADRG